MYKIIALALVAMLISPVALANDDMSSDSKPCATIADACSAAGFAKTDSIDKKFWKDCMKPIILGQKVEGVNVDADTIKSCRTNKIEQIKKELSELQSASR